MVHFVVSDLGLHCSQSIVYPNLKGYYTTMYPPGPQTQHSPSHKVKTGCHRSTQCLHSGKSGSQRLPKIALGLPKINARKSGTPSL